MEKTWTPVHDATLGDADAVFFLLAAYLRKLRIEQAGRVVFVGDGAEWIWTRVSRLIEELSLESVPVFEVVDYFHATSHLRELVEMREDLSSKEQKRLSAQWKRLLWEGGGSGSEAGGGAAGSGQGQEADAERAEVFSDPCFPDAVCALQSRACALGEWWGGECDPACDQLKEEGSRNLLVPCAGRRLSVPPLSIDLRKMGDLDAPGSREEAGSGGRAEGEGGKGFRKVAHRGKEL